MDLFTESIIQDRVKTFFTQSIESNRLAHAYLFYGHEGSGKEAFAFELAKVLNCASDDQKPCNECTSCIKINQLIHPDLQYVFPISKQTKPETITEIKKAKAANPYAGFDIEGHKNIPIEKIRELKNEAKYAPFEAKHRFFVLTGAEFFSREAANSFLKLLEEPPDNLMLILITEDLHRLLDTIRSRCQPVFFPSFSDEQITNIVNRYNPDEKDVLSVARIAQNNLKKVFNILESDSSENRERVYQFFRAVATNNMLDVADVIDYLTQKRDKNNIIEFLNLLILWLRDALHNQVLEDTKDFINLDYKESIEKFANRYKHSNLQEMITIIENASLDIQRNAHPALTLTNLALELDDHMVVTESPAKEVV